ncbi:hypothetical protein LTR53_017294, partial [Teratosphaeriaceae sp. CCFEE 6253]
MGAMDHSIDITGWSVGWLARASSAFQYSSLALSASVSIFTCTVSFNSRREARRRKRELAAGIITPEYPDSRLEEIDLEFSLRLWL